MKNPKRIQRKRVKGWKMPKGAIYVGRPSKWGNPYKIGQGTYLKLDRQVTINNYQLDLIEGKLRIKIEDIKKELKGKDLVCWCLKNKDCHADILLEIANK